MLGAGGRVVVVCSAGGRVVVSSCAGGRVVKSCSVCRVVGSLTARVVGGIASVVVRSLDGAAPDASGSCVISAGCSCAVVTVTAAVWVVTAKGVVTDAHVGTTAGSGFDSSDEGLLPTVSNAVPLLRTRHSEFFCNVNKNRSHKTQVNPAAKTSTHNFFFFFFEKTKMQTSLHIRAV